MVAHDHVDQTDHVQQTCQLLHHYSCCNMNHCQQTHVHTKHNVFNTSYHVYLVLGTFQCQPSVFGMFQPQLPIQLLPLHCPSQPPVQQNYYRFAILYYQYYRQVTQIFSTLQKLQLSYFSNQHQVTQLPKNPYLKSTEHPHSKLKIYHYT